MTVKRCDICLEDHLVETYFITVAGTDCNHKRIDAEASIDVCDNCKNKFLRTVETHDNHVRAAKK
jgi:hypothetical protein